MAIDPELVRSPVVRDVDVGPAVAVVVSDGDAEAGAVRLGDAGLRRDVDEMPAAVVSKQAGRHPMVGARTAVVAGTSRVVAQLVGGDGEIDVVRDKQIEEAVAV